MLNNILMIHLKYINIFIAWSWFLWQIFFELFQGQDAYWKIPNISYSLLSVHIVTSTCCNHCIFPISRFLVFDLFRMISNISHLKKYYLFCIIFMYKKSKWMKLPLSKSNVLSWHKYLTLSNTISMFWT